MGIKNTVNSYFLFLNFYFATFFLFLSYIVISKIKIIMKKIILFLVFFNLSVFADEKYNLVDSKLIEAKLYRNNAELYHEVELNLKEGINEYYISNVAQTILDNTIIAGSLNNGQVFSVDYIYNYADKSQLDKLKDSIKIVNRELELLGLYQGKKNLEIEVYEKIPKQIPNSNIKYTQLEIKEFSKLIDDELSRLFKDKIELEEKKIKLTEKKTELEQTLNDRTSEITKNIIRLTIKSDIAQKSKFFLNYICNNAGWHPSYDIFLEKIDSKGELISKANIRQHTGIDWDNVVLTLNDGYVSNNSVPNIWEWVFNYQKEIKNHFPSPKSGSIKEVRVKTGGFSAEIDGVDLTDQFNGGFGSPNNERYFDKVATNENENYTGKEYNLSDKFSIENKTENKLLRFKQDSLDLNVYLFSIPKVDSRTYIIAEIKDFQQHNLNEGEVTTYLEGVYKGKTYLSIPEKGYPEISFGVDKNIQVKRENLVKFSDSRFLSSNKDTKFKYKFTITNNKKVKINFKLKDHLPSIKSDDFELKTIDLSGAVKDYQGILTWEFDLEPSETIIKTLEFEVKHPEGFIIRD